MFLHLDVDTINQMRARRNSMPRTGEKRSVVNSRRVPDPGVGDAGSSPEREEMMIEYGRRSCAGGFEHAEKHFRTLGLFAQRAGR